MILKDMLRGYRILVLIDADLNSFSDEALESLAEKYANITNDIKNTPLWYTYNKAQSNHKMITMEIERRES